MVVDSASSRLTGCLVSTWRKKKHCDSLSRLGRRRKRERKRERDDGVCVKLRKVAIVDVTKAQTDRGLHHLKT